MFKAGKKVDVWKILEKDKLNDVNMNKQGKKFQKRVKKLEY
jgi:ribosomal protein S30